MQKVFQSETTDQTFFIKTSDKGEPVVSCIDGDDVSEMKMPEIERERFADWLIEAGTELKE